MSEKEFTAEEYRLAARVAGNRSIAADWRRKADRLDSERLAWLEEHGLIASEGGMVLSAELVEDVKAFMVWAAGRNNGVPWPSASVTRLHAAFKPFERKYDVVDADLADDVPMDEPEKWYRIQDVPDGVRVVSAEGDEFIGAPCDAQCPHGAHDYVNHYAPFTRAEAKS